MLATLKQYVPQSADLLTLSLSDSALLLTKRRSSSLPLVEMSIWPRQCYLVKSLPSVTEPLYVYHTSG